MSMYLKLNLAPSGIFPMSNQERPDLSHLDKHLRRLRVARPLTKPSSAKKKPAPIWDGLTLLVCLISGRAVRRRLASSRRLHARSRPHRLRAIRRRCFRDSHLRRRNYG